MEGFNIGANFRIYSLVGAKMGRKVISIKPDLDNIGHFQWCKTKSCFSADSIYLDDLVPLIKSKGIKTAIVKMDIEGAEHLALSKASVFFKEIFIPVIFKK